MPDLSVTDWVWLVTIFWLEPDNAAPSLPPSPPEQLCSAWLTSLHLLEFCQPFLCQFCNTYLSPYSICCLQYISPYSICFLQYLKQGPSSMDATELLMDPLKKRNIALHWILNCLGIGIANYPLLEGNSKYSKRAPQKIDPRFTI